MKTSISIAFKNLSFRAGLLFLITAGLCLPSSLTAAPAWDNGGGDFLWTNAANWNPDGVPTTSSQVQINANTTALTPVIFNTTATIDKIDLGTSVGNIGYLSIQGGTLIVNVSSASRIGWAGEGHVSQTGGSASFKQITLGDSATGTGSYVISGGILSLNQNATAAANDLYVGYTGVGSLEISGSGTIVNVLGDVSIGGDNATTATNATGTVSIDEGAKLVVGNSSNTTTHLGIGANVNSGRASTGTILLTGGSIETARTTGGVDIRLLSGTSVAAGGDRSATIRGYGTIDTVTTATASLEISRYGQIVADSDGVDGRVLDLSGGGTGKYTVFNTTENLTDGTGGFYATDKGKLIMSSLTVSTGATTTSINWGEAAADTTIDLVNSARMTLGAGRDAGELSVALLAIDNIELSNLPANALIAWDIDFTGASLDLEGLQVRFDHTAVVGSESDLKLYYSSTGDSWTELVTTIDTIENWASTTGTLQEGYYALAPIAVPEPRTWVLLLGGLATLVFLRKRSVRKA